MVFVMDSKLFVAVAVGTLIGLLAAPRIRRTVQAAPLPAEPARFQIQSTVADEPNSEGSIASVHRVFLVDTTTGKLWVYHGLLYHPNPATKELEMTAPAFDPIPVHSPVN
jgi:hypothetical protein